MRLIALTLLAAIVSTKELYEVFGPRERVRKTQTRRVESYARAKVDYNAYWSTRTQDNCTFGIDVLLVQDITESLWDDLEQMRNDQIPIMINTLSQSHPGSRFAIITHRDKPIWPLGNLGDFCARPGAPFSTDGDSILSTYQSLEATGGADGPESQFVALLAASQLPLYEWDPMHAHLIVVVTDAQPHFNLDGFNTMGLPEHPNTYDSADPEGQCVSVYYPSPDQVKNSLLNINAYLSAVLYDPQYQNGLVARSWQWMIRDYGETDEFLNLMSSDSSDFWARLSQIITELEDTECIASNTPTPPQSSAAASTSETIPGVRTLTTRSTQAADISSPTIPGVRTLTTRSTQAADISSATIPGVRTLTTRSTQAADISSATIPGVRTLTTRSTQAADISSATIPGVRTLTTSSSSAIRTRTPAGDIPSTPMEHPTTRPVVCPPCPTVQCQLRGCAEGLTDSHRI